MYINIHGKENEIVNNIMITMIRILIQPDMYEVGIVLILYYIAD